MVADGGSRLYVAVGTSGGGVEVTGEAVPFVQRMLAEKEFIAGDCLGWSDNPTPFAWSDVEMLLTKLTRDGLIEAASGAR
jgi:hypothetical protein